MVTSGIRIGTPAVGLQWQLGLARAHLPVTAFALSLKLVVMPLVAWSLVIASGLGGLAADVAVFEAAMVRN